MAHAKSVLKFFTYIQVLASLAMVGLGIYLLLSQLVIGLVTAILLLCLGIALLIIGCFGIIGAHRKSKFCICLYQIGILPITLAALTLAIVASVLSADLFSGDNNRLLTPTTCQWNAENPAGAICTFGSDSNNILQDLSEVSQEAISWFGRSQTLGDLTPDCGIYYPGGIAAPEVVTEDWKLSNIPGTAKNALQCDTQIDDYGNSSQFEAYAPFLQYIESTYDCSGVGYAIPYYMFRNFADTPFTSPLGVNNVCYSHIQETMESWFRICYITCYTVFSFLLLNVILSFCVCCSKRHHHHGDIYTRMDYSSE